jgi:hypothetical protein
MACRSRIANLLLQESSLMQIVKLIGSDVLPDDQKLVIEIGPRHPRRLPAAERLPQGRHLCAAGKAAQDDGDHPVSL